MDNSVREECSETPSSPSMQYAVNGSSLGRTRCPCRECLSVDRFLSVSFRSRTSSVSSFSSSAPVSSRSWRERSLSSLRLSPSISLSFTSATDSVESSMLCCFV